MTDHSLFPAPFTSIMLVRKLWKLNVIDIWHSTHNLIMSHILFVYYTGNNTRYTEYITLSYEPPVIYDPCAVLFQPIFLISPPYMHNKCHFGFPPAEITLPQNNLHPLIVISMITVNKYGPGLIKNNNELMSVHIYKWLRFLRALWALMKCIVISFLYLKLFWLFYGNTASTANVK